MGILCCRPDAVERFKGEGSSWRDLAAEDEMAGNRAGARGDARRLETEMPAMMGIAALSGSLAMRDEVGNHVIYSRVRLLAERLMLGLRGLGWNVITPPDPADRAGIVVFSHPAFDSREVMHKLRHLGIMISARNGTLRASPHFYNSEEEIDRLLAELSKEQAGA
jgi:selenocysteine lyase/cysteine desulfurase